MPRQPSQMLTDAELRVMNSLWDLGPSTVAGVVATIRHRPRPAYNTVLTLLRILEQKGYTAHEKTGRAFVYRAVVDRTDARQRALRHLVGRFFGDSPALLVLNVLRDERIDPAELARLRQLIHQAKESDWE